MDDPEERSQPSQLLDAETERASRQRLFDEVLAAVELVLVADGAAFWREEPDHSLVLTASRSLPRNVLDAFDRHVTNPLQSIMQRWPESPLVAVPLNDRDNPIAEEIRQITDTEGIVGLAGVPCRVPGETLGMLIVVHRRPHPWTVRDLGLATGLAGQLATATQNGRLFGSVRSLANRLAGIHELSLRLAQLRDAPTIAETIVAEVGRLVDCDTARLYERGRDGNLRPVAASGTFIGIESPPLEALSRPGETLPAWVCKRNEPLIIPDAAHERRSIFRSTFGPESLLLVPLSYGDEVQGVLCVSKAGANRYGPDDEQALSIFSRYAAQAIVNARNIEKLQLQQRQLERQLAAERRLLEIGERLVSTLDPRNVLELIADTIGDVVSFDRLTIYRLNPKTSAIEPVIRRPERRVERRNGHKKSAAAASGAAASGAANATSLVDLGAPVDGEPTPPTVSSEDYGSNEPHLVEEGLTSWVIGRGDAVCANGRGEGAGLLPLVPGEGDSGIAPGTSAGTAAASAAATAAASENIIVVPLRVHGEVVGSLNLIRVGGSETSFSEHEFEMGKLFASQASLALQNAETHETVSTRADLDALTGLRNHGTFQRDLSSLIEAGNAFSLLMLDLDLFKAFNDTYGHPAGDQLLEVVARALVGAIRQNDRAYRYGGDEFALLLRGASRTQAEEVAARVRVAVSEAVIASGMGRQGIAISASVGCAHWPADGREKADLVEAADAALYRAKRLHKQTGRLIRAS